MIYVYAIAERASAPPTEKAGIAGGRVQSLAHGALAGLYSSHPGAEPDRGEESMWRHEAVAEAAMSAGAVLPMRFGTLLRDESELRGVLEARHDELAAALARVRGRVEIGVRALWVEPQAAEPAETGAGRAYLLGKLERRREAERLADELHTPLARLAVEARLSLLPAPGAAFTGAYLVDQRSAPLLEREAARLARPRHNVELVCSGPWPPYNFTEAPDA